MEIAYGPQRLWVEAIGEGPPVVLLHGFTNYGLAWAPQLPALAYAGYRVVIPDLPGHGRSQPLAGDGTVAELAAAVRAVCDRLALSRLHLVGLSLGGMVALEFAVRWPERVAALVLADTSPEFTSPAARELAAAWARTLEGPNGSLARLRQAWPLLVTPAFAQSPAGQAVWDNWQAVLQGVSGTGLARVARAMTGFDRRDDLAGLRLPVLVLTGQADRVFPPAVAADLHRAIAGSRLVPLADAGHLSNLEQPAAFNRALLQFFAALAPTF